MGPWVHYIICWIFCWFEILFIATNVDFPAANSFGFVLCFAKACTFSKSACLSASSLFYLTRYLLTYSDISLWICILFHIHLALWTCFKGHNQKLCKIVLFLLSLLTIFFLDLHLIESTSSFNDVELLNTPPHWCFCLLILVWFELQPNPVCQLACPCWILTREHNRFISA